MTPGLTEILTALTGFLLQSALYSAVLVPLILLIQWVSGRLLSPTLKHALWLILLLRLTIPELPESSLSIFNLSESIRKQDIQKQINNSHLLENPSHLMATSEPIPAIELDNTIKVQEPEIESIPPSITIPNSGTASEILPPPATVETSQQTQPSVPPLHQKKTSNFSWPMVLVTIWSLGLFAITIRILQRGLRFRAALSEVEPITSPLVLSQLECCKKALKVRSSIEVYETDSITSPAIYGLIRPKILLPKGFTADYSQSDLAHVFAHELAHIKRLDPIWNLWVTLIQVVHWPNPAIWYAVRRIAGDRESATDFLALEATQNENPSAYGETILKTLRSTPHPTLTPGLIGISENRGSLRRRFRMISSFRFQRRYSLRIATAILLPLIAVCLTDAGFSANPRSENPKTIVTSAKSSSETPSILHTMTIRVIDPETNAKLAGIPISYTFNRMSQKPISFDWASTNAEGFATLEIIDPTIKDYYLTIQAVPKKDYTAQTRRWINVDGNRTELPDSHTFYLSQGTRIGGKVVDDRGLPIANAAISLTGKAAVSVQTDPNNRSSLFAPFQLGIKTDKYGLWHFSGAPRELDSVNLIIRDSNGSESRFSTGHGWFEERHFLFGDPIRLADLRSGSNQVTLPKGNDIEIQVTDDSGRPISNAQIQELFGTPIKQHGTISTTDQSGKAIFRGRTRRELLYVASHSDYASASVIARPGIDKSPVKVILPVRQPLAGFIVDTSGSPIEGALVSLHPYINEKFYSNWTTLTGVDGKFVWEQAPEVETFLQFQADGFKTVVSATSPTDDSPKRVSLPNSDDFKISISALVLDGRNDKPMSQFEYRLRREHGSGFADWTPARGGLVHIQTTHQELTQELLQSKGIFYHIDCRAPGYQSIASRRLNTSENNPSIKITLNPISNQHNPHGVQLLAPDGTPARGATVFLVGDSLQSMPNFTLRPYGLIPSNGSTDYRFRTDSEGRFPAMNFPIGFRGLVVSSRQGMVAVPSDSLNLNSGILQLKGFGVLKGTLSIGDWEQSNRRIDIQNSHENLPLFNLWAYSEVDAEGTFNFEGLPEGDYRLHIYRPGVHPDHRIPTYQKSVRVYAEKVQQFDYANSGREISGRIVSNTLPSPINFVDGRFYLHNIEPTRLVSSRPRPDQFVSHENFTTENYEYIIRRQGIERRSEQSYYLNLTSNGEFIIDSVPPGDYILEAAIFESKLENTINPKRFPVLGKPLAHLLMNVNIPSGDSLAPVDLGEIMINKSKKAKASLEGQRPIGKAIQNNTSSAPRPVIAEKTGILPPSAMEISVVDFLSGEPMTEAYVTVETIGTTYQGSKKNRFRTNDKGTVKIEWAESVATVHVKAHTRGYLALQKSFHPRMQPLPRRYEFRLEKGKRVYGRVTDDSGKPIPGVKIVVNHLNTHRYGNSVVTSDDLPETNALGRWRFDEIPLDVEWVYLQFLHPRMAIPIEETNLEHPQSSNQKRHIVEYLTESTTKARDVLLRPGEQISGKVIDHNHTPVTNAHIRILESCCANSTTDSNGQFEFPGSYVGPISLLITAPGASPRIVKSYVAPGVTPLVYQLEEGQRQTFEFVDPSGNPISGVSVIATKWAELVDGPIGPAAISDSLGRIDWDSAPREFVDYLVHHENYSPQTIKRLSPSETLYRMTLYPRTSTTVTFRVTDQAGNPIPDFEIQSGQPTELPGSPQSINWDWKRKSLGSNGLLQRIESNENRESDGSIGGKYLYRTESFGYVPHISRVIDTSEKQVILDIVLESSNAHRGVLLDVIGSPIANHRLRRIEQGDTPRIRQGVLATGIENGKPVKTDISGRFEFPRTDEPFTLLGLNSKGYALVQNHSDTETLTMNLEQWGRINGRWLDGENPVEGKVLGFQLAKDSRQFVPVPKFEDRATTDSSGSFEFSSVPPGKIEILDLTGTGIPTVKTNLTIRPNSESFIELR